MLNHKKMLNPFPENEKNIYGRIINCEKVDTELEEFNVEITLTNDEMIKFDNDIYGDEGLLSSINDYSIEPIKNLKDRIHELDIEYDIGVNKILNSKEDVNKIYDLFTPYFYEFYATIKDIGLAKKLQQYSDQGTYLQLVLLPPKDCEQYNEKDFIKGSLLFSASPIVVKNRTIFINEETKGIRNKFKGKYKSNKAICNTQFHEINKHDKDAVKKFNDALSNCLPKKINEMQYTMFHIGQGLCSYISFNRNSGMFFDIGFSEKGRNDNSIKFDNYGNFVRYKYRKPKAIILSHWDVDHILGIVYADKDVFNKVWIAPSFEDLNDSGISNSALRLCKYISLKEGVNNHGISRSDSKYERSLFIINKSFNDDIVFKDKSDKFMIHKGKGTATNGHSNKANNIGLLIELKNTKNIILTGDIDYKKMPSSISTKKVDYFQVPHHGAACGDPILVPQNINNSKAFLPVSEKHNRHNHPRYNEHLDILKKRGFKVCRTDKDGDCTCKL